LAQVFARFVLDVDKRLDARQIPRQGAAVGMPLAHSLRARGRRLGFVRLGLSRLALVNLLERQQQLIFRVALGPATKAVALQALMIWMNRYARWRSAISIAFSV
jgi:hypothetical protein